MKVIIIGAGLAGLGAGLELKKRGIDFEIIEASEAPGGLAKTDVIENSFFDYTGHFLHVKTDEGYQDLIESTVPFIKIEKKSAVLINSKIIPYPLQYNLSHLEIGDVTNILSEIDNIESVDQKIPVDTLTEFIEKHFGKTLCNMFFKPYNEKLWGTRLEMLPKDCLGNYFPKIDTSLLREGCKQDTKYTGYNDFFYYPAAGQMGLLPDNLALNIKDKIKYSTKLVRVDHTQKICYDSNGNEYQYDYLITSIPLNSLADAIGDINIRPKFMFTSLKNIRIIIKGQLLHSYHWFYIPDKNLPFYRIGFPQNVVKETCPDGYTSISVEVEINNCKLLSDKDIASSVIDYLTTYNLICAKEILSVTSKLISPAYTYSPSGDTKTINDLLKFLKTYNIISVGRYGLWKYFSMEEAYLSGKDAVKSLFSYGKNPLKQII